MSLKTNFTIIPNEYQQPVLESWSKTKLVRGKPGIGKTMLAALLAQEVRARGDDTWYRSPYLASVEKFVEYSLRLNPKLTIKRRGTIIKVGTKLWASHVIKYPYGGYAPDLLILDQVEGINEDVSRYLEVQQTEHSDTVIIYDPILHADSKEHELDYCEYLYTQHLQKKVNKLTMDVLVDETTEDIQRFGGAKLLRPAQSVFDYSPTLPGGYVPTGFTWRDYLRTERENK